MERIRLTDKELRRFESKFRRTRSCWLWQAAKDSHGFGVFSLRGRQVQAHRLSYQHFIAALGKDQVVGQTCEKHECIKPEHLKISKKNERTHCPNGHLYTPENMVTRKKTARRCLQCYNSYYQPGRKPRTHCPHGHQLTPDNLYLGNYYVTKSGEKKPHYTCKTCLRKYQRNWNRRRRSSISPKS